ncbi:MAG: hypothetical protein JXX28_08880 [Deltaproteobacteria bacterium]|nr:hypothetical protein [Deltaproteobacteria bacterium]
MRTPLLALLVPSLLTACADYKMASEDYGETADTGYSPSWDSDADTDADMDADTDADTDEDGWAAEDENDFLALRPAQTDVFVFVANPSRGTITRINVENKEVLTASVGKNPSAVLTTPDYGTAVVFNKGDDSVTVLDAQTMEGPEIAVRDNFNSMVMSPDGEWVALWHSLAAEQDDDVPPTGLQSFNEASFVNVRSGDHYPMAVGFNPRGIQFTPDGTLAIVVSDEYLAMVDLTAQHLTPDLIQVADDLLDPPRAEEVLITPSGEYAFVRQFGAQDLLVVDLLVGSKDRVPVGLNPTDLDLSPDGTEAVVVSRGSHELYLLDVAAPLDVPRVLTMPTEDPFGSLLFDPSGRQAVLYTTAVATDRYASWDLDTDEITLRPLVKPVKGMAVTPTGDTLMAFHTQGDVPDADPTSPFYNQWALSLIDLDSFRTNPLLLDAEPVGYANSYTGEHGYFVMKDVDALVKLRYDTLLPDVIPLKSKPVYVGVFPQLDGVSGEPAAWVSQEHDLGRISFYDPDDNTLETITGFELNSQIED